ncbi:GNAT family N-acetyltransferase [Lysinibacillus telephonicus]|uniref:GNAT family N-acetyltransferase n=1 Tax=Lysinibacillus telephonicus TaxID=1714840 RepID=A0A431UUN7_9BACI|nr:GNAT family N-acetyltransferase [Lysinibacillus telephonicus]RTQ94284.1 GNAT family N-acetyltransferase [Lysinibacillus telephonicus]
MESVVYNEFSFTDYDEYNCDLVQQSIRLQSIYRNFPKMNYRYIVCTDQSKIVGVMPFIHYTSKLSDIIHSMPFIGYGGPTVITNHIEVFNNLISTLEEYAILNNISLITICTSPFDEFVESYKNILNPDFTKENFYQFIELDSHYLEQMKSKQRNNLKRNLRIANQNNIILKESYNHKDLKFWYENVYVPRLVETNGAIYPIEVFETFRKEFGGKRVIINYAIENEKIIGAGFFIKQKKSLDNFMRVISTDKLYTQAGVLLDKWSIDFALENNFKYYNWQSADAIDSSIYNYKASWGSKTNKHYYLTKKVGDISKLLNVPLSTIKEEYKNVYVLPFEVFEKGK